MDLKPLNRGRGDNRYCGPAVVSFVTGLNTSDVARLIRERNGRTAVRGTYRADLLHVFKLAGYEMRGVFVEKANGRHPTLARWLKDSKGIRTPGRVFLVLAGHHWQLITGRRYACGIVGKVVSIRDERVARRARVASVLEIVEMPDRAGKMKTLKQRLDADRAYQKADRTAYQKAQRLARELGATIEVDSYPGSRNQYWLDLPPELDALFEDGHLDLTRTCYDWDEVASTLSELKAATSVIPREQLREYLRS